MLDHGELDGALVDVRRAYRLIWAYQRRVFDIVRVVTDGFENHKFLFWEPHEFEPPPRRMSDPRAKWAWDMLPDYAFSVILYPIGGERGRPQEGQWMLEISIVSDDGYEPDDDVEPDATAFRDPSKCASSLNLCAWQCTSSRDIDWVADVYDQLYWPEKEGEVEEHADPPFRLIWRSFNLATLSDKPAIEGAVCEFKHTLQMRIGAN